MAKLAVFILFVLPAITIAVPMSEPVPVGLPVAQASVAAGGAGGKYQNTEMGSEEHDKKQGSISFSSDKGSSNHYKNTAAAVGVGGMAAQGSAPVLPPPYNPYPYPSPYYPPQYPYGWGWGR